MWPHPVGLGPVGAERLEEAGWGGRTRASWSLARLGLGLDSIEREGEGGTVNARGRAGERAPHPGRSRGRRQRQVFGGAPPRGSGRRRWLGVSPAKEGGGSHRRWKDPGGGGRIPPDPSSEQGGSREPTTNSMAVAARSTAGERREVRERQGYEEEGGGAVLRLGSGGDDRLGCHSGWRGSEAKELVPLGDGRLGHGVAAPTGCRRGSQIEEGQGELLARASGEHGDGGEGAGLELCQRRPGTAALDLLLLAARGRGRGSSCSCRAPARLARGRCGTAGSRASVGLVGWK